MRTVAMRWVLLAFETWNSATTLNEEEWWGLLKAIIARSRASRLKAETGVSADAHLQPPLLPRTSIETDSQTGPASWVRLAARDCRR